MRHERRCFGRLEQEDQRLKKHYGRWMDIVRSLELESFILTKLAKPSIPVNLVGPQVSLPQRWVPASRGSIPYLGVIRRHFLACEDIAGGSDLSAGRRFFREIQKPFPRTVHVQCIIRRNFPCMRPWTSWVPAVRLSTYSPLLMTLFVDHATPSAARWWTTAWPRTATTRRWEDAVVESQI